MQVIMSKDIIERLSRYRSVLLRLKSLGFVRVFSDNLADALGVSASLVRKDLGLHGIRGVKRGGYQIEELIERLTHVLGVSGVLKIVVIGCGHIGSALLRTYGGKRHGINAVAGFDIKPEIINAEAPVPVLDVHELSAFVAQHAIDVAVLCVPEEAAATVMEQIRGSRIRGCSTSRPRISAAMGSVWCRHWTYGWRSRSCFVWLKWRPAGMPTRRRITARRI